MSIVDTTCKHLGKLIFILRPSVPITILALGYTLMYRQVTPPFHLHFPPSSPQFEHFACDLVPFHLVPHEKHVRADDSTDKVGWQATM